MQRSSGTASAGFAVARSRCSPAAVGVTGQITVPNTFVNGTVADAPQVNANFNALGAGALNRTGGTMTGTLTADDGRFTRRPARRRGATWARFARRR
jgi:hypothetical protein